MLLEEIIRCQPHDWKGHCMSAEKYVEEPLSSTSMDYLTLETAMMGNFSSGIKRITRVENPYLYGSFLLKQAEYKSRGVPVAIKQLYHDTAEHKIDSILSTNLDWRLTCRSKFGKGVSFSSSTSYANKYSSMHNGTNRAMIVADVLVGLCQHTNCSNTLPSNHYDTTIGNGGKVYVKFYDDEFYPKYVIYYNSIQQVQSSRYKRIYTYDDFLNGFWG